ncbi:hypothetical protein ACFWFU_36065 [Streptomyces sp. NPDC060235]|uniref:hypothetical protein n=1 Tax=Streptomyces sp. NPDC060235 TaxID=3347080 RepID=UPI00365A625A
MNRKSISRRGASTLFATVLAALALGVVPAGSASAVTDTPESYISYLESQGAAGSTTLTQFKALSADNQQKFLGYISDSALTIELTKLTVGALDDSGIAPDWNPNTGTAGPTLPADAPTSPFSSTSETTAMANAAGTVVNTQTLAGGDVVMQSTTGVTDVNGTAVNPTAGKAADWHAWYSVKDKVLGVTVTEVKIWIDYHSTTTKVTKMYNCNGSHKNMVPASSYKMGTPKKWISAAKNAHGEISWGAELSGQEWSGVQRIWGDETGYRGGSLKD